jgi:hypothetical protein
MTHFCRSVLFITFTAFFLISGLLIAQTNFNGNQIHPDSLIEITVTGTAILDTTHQHPLYLLDENGDSIPDYFLNFGPYWYEPDSGDATRPDDGATIIIYGGMHDPINNLLPYPVIIVYEINGEFWRDPFDPYWCGFPRHHHTMGYAYGWLNDSLHTVNVSGVAMVDTTFQFNKYFLDENQDNTPDYFLNFGPPWYEPTSGATRPADGDYVTIVGGLCEPDSLLPRIIVYEIDGLIWRDSTLFAPQLGGRWIYRYMTQAKYMYSPWDTLCGIRIQAGWHMGLPGMNMPDSIFGQMLQLFPQNLPQTRTQNAFAGFEVGMFGPMGNNLMSGGMMGDGQLIFNNQVQLKFHYNEIQLQGHNINENSIQLRYWDNQTNSWINASEAILNPTENTVTFYTSSVSSFYILTGTENALILTDPEKMQLNGFVLAQNYPNPFNPTTKIGFILTQNAQVELTVYNVLGQKIANLLNQPMVAGQHHFEFSANDLPSGTYFYELKVDGKSQIRKMNLIK